MTYLRTAASLAGALLTIALSASVAHAGDLRVANVFGDHMVLQKEKPVRIWGWGDPGAEGAVGFAHGTDATRTASATVTADGSWTASQ